MDFVDSGAIRQPEVLLCVSPPVKEDIQDGSISTEENG